MTWIQWVFHYFEIKDMNGEERKLFLEKMNDMELSLQAFYLIVDNKKGEKMIDIVSDIKSKNRKGNNKNSSNQNSKTDDELPDLLSDEEKELWQFMLSQPATIKETKHMKNVGKFILPTVNKEELLKSQVKIVNKSNDIEKPKLGF